MTIQCGSLEDLLVRGDGYVSEELPALQLQMLPQVVGRDQRYANPQQDCRGSTVGKRKILSAFVRLS